MAKSRAAWRCRLLAVPPLGGAAAAVILTLMAVAVGSGSVIAQGLPNAPLGERPEDRIRQLPDQRRLEAIGGRVDPVQIPRQGPAQDTSASTLKFKVRKVALSNSAVLDTGRLAALVARVEGREVVLEDLNRLVRDINRLYQEANFPVGFAILPPQTVENGVVQIVLIEPRVDGVEVASRYTDAEYLRRRIPLQQGDLVDVHALERALLVLRRTSVSGIQVAARLVPGDDFATTRIVLDVIEPPRHSVISITDNHGTRESGRLRNQTLYRNTSVLGRDDPLAVGVSIAEGSKSVFGIYDVPVAIPGTRVEFQYSLSESRIVGGNFADLDLESDGQFAAVEVRHPFFVERDWMLYGLAETAFSHGRTTTGPLETGTAVGRFSLGARLFRFDDDGYMQWTARAVFFRARAYDNFGAEWNSYVKFAGDFNFVRHVGPITLVGDAAWQLSPSELLPSSEQFAFGGVTTLRAYEINQFNGDQGYLARLEAHGPGVDLWRAAGDDPLDSRINAFAFVETGGAIPFRNGGGGARREDFATDYGLGVRLGLLGGKINTRAMIAKSIDNIHEPLIISDPKFLFDVGIRLDF